MDKIIKDTNPFLLRGKEGVIMKKFFKPEVKTVVNEDLAEGIYMMDSGWIMTNCYTTTWDFTQSPEIGRDTFVGQINATHEADHSCEHQYLIITFSHPIDSIHWTDHNMSLSADKTMARVLMDYHNNQSDSIGLASVEFTIEYNAGYDRVEILDIYYNDIGWRHN